MKRQIPLDKIEVLNKVRARWAEIQEFVYTRYKCRIPTPKQILFVKSRGFNARVWTSSTQVSKLEINEDVCLHPLNIDKFIKNTIGHEAVHAWDAAKNGRASGHGPKWQALMAFIGLPANRCNTYENNLQVPSGNLKPVCNNSNVLNLEDY